MKWEKIGHVFCADNQNDSMCTYGRMPTPLHLRDDIYRIYFESRNKSGTANPYYLDLELSSSPNILDVNENPLLHYGSPGTFDDNGITPFSVCRVEDRVRLYYVGWNRCVNVPFRNGIGIAESDDGGVSFKKLYQGPILAQDKFDPIFPTGPLVIQEKGGWKMWYTSFVEWKEIGGGFRHYYDIKYRESPNGIDWNGPPKPAIQFKNEHEYAFVCRGVIKDFDRYRMWYSFRAQHNIETYRIGYAESVDGINWTRMDELMNGFDVTPGAWDSEMVCYPAVFEHKEKKYMLYNGNGYGQTGFGLAVLKEDK